MCVRPDCKSAVEVSVVTIFIWSGCTYDAGDPDRMFKGAKDERKSSVTAPPAGVDLPLLV